MWVLVFACALMIPFLFQVLVRNVPPDPDESVSEHVEHFFCVNHPDHYLLHQVCGIYSFIAFCLVARFGN